MHGWELAEPRAGALVLNDTNLKSCRYQRTRGQYQFNDDDNNNTNNCNNSHNLGWQLGPFENDSIWDPYETNKGKHLDVPKDNTVIMNPNP